MKRKKNGFLLPPIPGLIYLDDQDKFALERMADPINAKGLWFVKAQVPKSMLNLIRAGLIVCLVEEQADICFQITPSGMNYYRHLVGTLKQHLLNSSKLQ